MSTNQPQDPNQFTPPRHWVGVEELSADYWSDPKIQEKRGQEFFEKPIEFIDKLDASPEGGLARRDFLTIMGASMAMATTACVRRPVHKIIPYVIRPEEITPGVPNYYASTCRECSTACGILTKNREGRPIKLEGNPDHPMNAGRLCARGQASILNLYDTDRLKTPLARTRGAPGRILHWDEVDHALVAKWEAIAKGTGRVRVLSGAMAGDTTARVIQDFLSNFKNGQHVEFEPLAIEEIAQSQEISYGAALVPHYKFDQANVVLSLGADFLGNWLSPVEYAAAWGRLRKLDREKTASEEKHASFSKLIVVEPTLTITGSNADEKMPVRPGDEFKVGLAIAYELIVNRKLSRFASDSAVTNALSAYKPETVAADVGGDVKRIKSFADELWTARGKSLVVAGSPQSATKDALALQVVANLLNSALENEGVTVDGTQEVGPSRSSFAAVTKLIEEMKSGLVDALVIYNSNPVYTIPKAAGFAEAMKKVPLVVVATPHDDETSWQADYVLAEPHYLENWGDANPRKGLYSLQQPAIAPLHDTRAFQDTLIAWAKASGFTKGLIAKAADWHDYLQQSWKETVYKEHGGVVTFPHFWEGALRAGVYDARKMGAPSSRAFRTTSLKMVPNFQANSADEISLALYSKVSMGDGRSANNAWLQEMPDPISSVCWDNYVNLSPALAKKLDVKTDDVVEVTVGASQVELAVYVQPGLHGSVASAALGYGRVAAGNVGDGAGIDMYPFAQADSGRLIYSGQKAKLVKTGKVYSLAKSQWSSSTANDRPETLNRPVVNDITYTEFRQDPGKMLETDPELKLETVPTIWPKHEYTSYRWGMAVDLTSCIGCGACVIGCQAENNVPVVGRQLVRNSRLMHWIRIDRYYSGSQENPDLVFQPMMCQHCENAPCETVCPVLATVHDDEGLNVQVYNRCVGTRYCQNNCPYKVRRFNFFDHWKSYEGTMNLAWNPDVSVRSRGIMEKCTFCTQRITEQKDLAKDKGEKVQDGALKTACQQTCPTDAIVFGDINDPTSRVSKLRNGPRGFRALEVLNTVPSVTYLTKVRNKESG